MASSKPQDEDKADLGAIKYNEDALCQQCSSAFRNTVIAYNSWRKYFSECDESEELVLGNLKEYPARHHRSFHRLRRTAQAGCHLCNLIETYSTAFLIDPDLPVTLAVDIGKRADRECTFDVSVEKRQTEVRLGLQGIYGYIPARHLPANCQTSI